VADETTLTGSIGVVVSTYNVKQLADQYGVKGVVIASGENKAFLDPLQEIDPEQVQVIKTIVDQAHEQFIERVLTSQNLDESRLRQLADGRPLSGQQAHQEQLVDKLGTFYESIEIAKTAANVTNVQVVEYSFGGLLQGLLGYLGTHLTPLSALPQPFSNSLGGTPLYLYSL
jgi:protease-4